MIEPDGVRAALQTGVGAVVVKSTNENPAAGRQLGHTDYAMFDSAWRRLPWNFDPPQDASLLNRSGLSPHNLDRWITDVAKLVSEQGTSWVIPSVIPGSYDAAPELVKRIVNATGSGVVEVNVGAPHGDEVVAGALTLERETDAVTRLVGSLADVLDVPLWIKITGQSDNVPQLAAAAFAGGADAVTLITRHMAMLPDLHTQAPALGTVLAYGGSWALPITCRWLALTRQLVGAEATLIGTHGARTGSDVARMMLAGASAVQLTSAVFTGGYSVLQAAMAELDEYLTQHSQAARDLVGLAADRLSGYTDQPLRRGHVAAIRPPSQLTAAC